MIFFFVYVTTCASTGITLCQWCHQWHHCISKVKTINQIQMKHDFFGYVIPLALVSHVRCDSD